MLQALRQKANRESSNLGSPGRRSAGFQWVFLPGSYPKVSYRDPAAALCRAALQILSSWEHAWESLEPRAGSLPVCLVCFLGEQKLPVGQIDDDDQFPEARLFLAIVDSFPAQRGKRARDFFSKKDQARSPRSLTTHRTAPIATSVGMDPLGLPDPPGNSGPGIGRVCRRVWVVCYSAPRLVLSVFVGRKAQREAPLNPRIET